MEKPKVQKVHLEPLAVALKLEQEGRKFFVDCAENFESKLAKQTFKFLASEEDKHIARIEEFYKNIEETGETGLPDLGGTKTDDRFAAFDARLSRLRDEVKSTATDVEAYRYALKFENGAELFYDKCMKESNDENIKSFYKWLIEEEAMHSKVLEACLKFAEDPEAFFKNRDSAAGQ